MSKFCISIMAEDLLPYLDNIKKKFHDVDYIEVRFDNHQLINEVKGELSAIKEQLICTIRTVREGGGFKGPPNMLLESYRKLIEIQPRYIDIGLGTGIYERIVDAARDSGVGVIGSYHNRVRTPEMYELEEIYSKLVSTDIDVVKIVTMATRYIDNLRILNFLAEHRGGKPLIAFCMSDKGRISRVFAYLLGSYITYVSMDGGKTAPGQISLEEFMEILRCLNAQY